MTDTTDETTTTPPATAPTVQDLTELQGMLRRIPDDSHDPRDARQVAYHLNQRRAVVSHTNRSLQEGELWLEEARQTRALLIRRNERVVAEINDLDRAIKAREAEIAVLRGE